MGMVAAETVDGEMVDAEIDVAETVMAVSAEAASDAPGADKAEAADEAEAAGDVATVAEAEAANNAGVAGEFAAAEAEAVAAGLPVADLVDEGEERVGDGVLIGALSDGHGIASVVVDSAPLSSTQTRLRELHAVGERPAVYNVAHRVVLSGDLDPAALEHALWMLVDRHPALRTRFVDRPGGAVQEVLDQVPVRLPVEDLGMATDGGESWSEALASEGLEPGEAPLWRAHLGRLADDRWVLVLVVHHLITDAWSTALIWSDLSSLYAEVLAGMPNPLGPSASYTEYTRWRLAETSTRRTELERFWHSELDGARLRLPLPYDRPRPERLSGNGATMRFDVPARTAALLDRVAEKLGSTRASVLTAAYAVWMSRLSGERDLVVALSSPSRVRPEHAKTVGPVGEALLVRLCLGTEIRFADLVAQVGTRVFKALDHHALGLAEVYRLVDPERPTESPQVLFTVDTTPQSRLELPGASAEIEPLEAPGTARTELYFVLAPSADGISGRFEYSTDLFDEKTVDGWRTGFLAVLDEVSLSPGGII